MILTEDPDFSEMESPHPIEGEDGKPATTYSWQIVQWLKKHPIGFRFTAEDVGLMLGLPRHHGSISGFLAKAAEKGVIEKRSMRGEWPDYILMKDPDLYGARMTLTGEGPKYEVERQRRIAMKPPETLDGVRDKLIELAAAVESLANHKLENVSTDDLLTELKARMK